jgi:hypothetical protein
MAVQPGTLNLTLERGIEFSSILLQCKDEGVSVGGTLAPNVVGTFTPHGTFGNYARYILDGSPSTFLYFNTTAASYVIARLLTQAALTDYWVPAAPITEPTGTYVAHGANIGTATATDHIVDLTGYTAEAQVRRNPRGANMILDLNPSVTSPTLGEITIPAISSDDTSALTSYGKFYWDLVLKNSGSSERLGPFVAGSFTISDTITQEGAAPPEL